VSGGINEREAQTIEKQHREAARGTNDREAAQRGSERQPAQRGSERQPAQRANERQPAQREAVRKESWRSRKYAFEGLSLSCSCLPLSVVPPSLGYASLSRLCLPLSVVYNSVAASGSGNSVAASGTREWEQRGGIGNKGVGVLVFYF
jgi:hypothetical protein